MCKLPSCGGWVPDRPDKPASFSRDPAITEFCLIAHITVRRLVLHFFTAWLCLLLENMIQICPLLCWRLTRCRMMDPPWPRAPHTDRSWSTGRCIASSVSSPGWVGCWRWLFHRHLSPYLRRRRSPPDGGNRTRRRSCVDSPGIMSVWFIFLAFHFPRNFPKQQSRWHKTCKLTIKRKPQIRSLFCFLHQYRENKPIRALNL